MLWNEEYNKTNEPSAFEIETYIASPLFQDFLKYMETSYNCKPALSYSSCTMNPGWNLKFQKASRSLTTLYPESGGFTLLVVIGEKDQMEAELVLPELTAETQNLYRSVPPYNGSRWLMIPVFDQPTLFDAKRLIAIRRKPDQKQ